MKLKLIKEQVEADAALRDLLAPMTGKCLMCDYAEDWLEMYAEIAKFRVGSRLTEQDAADLVARFLPEFAALRTVVEAAQTVYRDIFAERSATPMPLTEKIAHVLALQKALSDLDALQKPGNDSAQKQEGEG